MPHNFPRLAVQEAAIALAIEQGEILRDPARRDSDEFTQMLLKKQNFIKYCHQHGLDTRILARMVERIPYEVFGPVKPEVPFVYVKPDDFGTAELTLVESPQPMPIVHESLVAIEVAA